MKLYHGSYTKIKEIDLSQCARYRDFGQGYVEVAEEKQRRFKPEVEESLQKSLRGEDLVRCKDAEDMFKQWGLRK